MSEGINIQNDEEIQKALKDFEVKSETDVERRANQDLEPQKASSIVDLVIKYSNGAIKDERQAEYILLAFVAVAIIVSLFLFFGGENTQQRPTTTSIEQMKQFMNTVPSRSN